MRDITLHNFRCYEEAHFDFRSGINLLIGDNASGKTSVLHACNLVNNAFFAGFSDENTRWEPIDNANFQLLLGPDNTSLPERPLRVEFHLDDWANLPIGNLLYLAKRSRKGSRNLTSGLTEYRDFCKHLLTDTFVKEGDAIRQRDTLPLFAYYPTGDIHSSRHIAYERFAAYSQKPSFGYYGCYDCSGLLDYWLKRLLVLREAETGETEIETVRRAVHDCLGPDGCDIIDDLILRPMRGKAYFRFTDGRMVESDMLSDGYRRLVNIVVDIAIRCALLNKVAFGSDSYRQTYGTVIIDEIDAHLHPQLQTRILAALHRTFPNLQFIVSTHAPLVMSGVKPAPENVVYHLTYDHATGHYSHSEINTYGLDASTIIQLIMGITPRDSETNHLIDQLFESIDDNNLTQADQRLQQLRDMNDLLPELTQAETLINLTRSLDEEN